MVVICKYCNKEYASYASRSNHIKKYHNNDNIQCNVDVTNCNVDVTNCNNNSTCEDDNLHVKLDNKLKCSICKLILNNRQTKWRHEKKCKGSNDNKIQKDNELLKDEVALLKVQMESMKKYFTELMNKQCKVHPKTLTKIKNQLNTLNDNKVINNNVIIQFGREKLYEVFSKKEQIDVLNHGYMCLENLIEKAHFNHKYPQFKNIIITNLQNNIAYKYNAATNNFDVVTKKELLEDIISDRMYDIEEFFNNYKDDISSKMQNIIETFIKKMDTESYEDTKKNNIKIILYNNRMKVKMTTPQLDQEEELIV